MTYKFKHGVLGGTFDRLHLGHKDLIDTAFSLSEKVDIGLATEKIYKKKFLAHLIESYSVRESELKNYLREKKYLQRSNIVVLNDIFGLTLKAKNYNAIFVTQTTLPNAKIINEERNKTQIAPLDIITVPLRQDDSGKVITSERIRLGEIDREGHDFMTIFKYKDKLTLPPGLRKELRQPIGKKITDIQKIKDYKRANSLLITVGDIVSKSLREINCIPDIEIIDFKTRRQEINKKLFKAYKGKKYNNQPGVIQKKVVEVYKEAIRKCVTNHDKKTIVIAGEEDLLALPAILLAPLGTIVCYGQYDLNAVIQVDVTEEIKKIILDLLRQFE